MSAWHRTTVLLFLTSSLVKAQLTIENPRHVDVPEPQAQALFLTTSRVVEKEFHVPGVLENKFRMKLVLGETPERFTIDDPAGNGTLCLERWNEFEFTAVAMRLAIQQLLIPERQERMIAEILRRAHEIAPVSAAKLGKQGVPPPHPAAQIEENCIATIANAAGPGVPCGPLRPGPARW